MMPRQDANARSITALIDFESLTLTWDAPGTENKGMPGREWQEIHTPAVKLA